jgi:hypothetical protein
MMSKGISIHIGVNKLCVGIYNTEDPLCSPAQDAEAMAFIAAQEGYSVIHKLINQEATTKRFLEIFDSCIQQLHDGDTLFMTFSGHGGQIDDKDGDELDGKDEIWCFYDHYLIDDDLREKWQLFRKGVRIIVVSSSCHSRSTLKVCDNDCFSGSVFKADTGIQKIVNQNGKSILEAYFPDPLIKAGIVHLSACEDYQQSEDGEKYTAFTRVLLKHWDHGKFKGTYEDLVRNIQLETGYTQKAGIATLGNNDPLLLNSIPFKLLTK